MVHKIPGWVATYLAHSDKMITRVELLSNTLLAHHIVSQICHFNFIFKL